MTTMTIWEDQPECAVDVNDKQESEEWRPERRQGRVAPCQAAGPAPLQLEEVCAAFENIPDTVISIDDTCRIRTINHPPAGLAIGELLGTDLFTVIAPEDKDMVRAAIDRVFATGEPGRYEIRHRGADNSICWLETRLVRLGGDRSAHRVLLVTRDITGDKAMEHQASQLDKAESLRRMAGAIAHRYNNLLAVVMGNLELTMEDLPLDFKHTHQMWQAMLATRQAAKVGSLILASLGQTVVDRRSLNLTEVCRQHLDTLRAAMPQNVKLEVSLHAEALPVVANAEQIRQILDILTTNGYEALGPRPGTVFLSITSVNQVDMDLTHRFPIVFQPSAVGYGCITVQDEGDGIAEKEIGKIFDPFYTTKYVSRGMGLAVAQGIVGASCGCMTVGSVVGKGSVFRAYLPLTTAQP